jgi:hypothetical protein
MTGAALLGTRGTAWKPATPPPSNTWGGRPPPVPSGPEAQSARLACVCA